MSSRIKFRFANFELDVAAYKLSRDGLPIRLERQPMDVLIMLLERSGALVSRQDIVDRLWGKDVFVDVETGVHTAIRKIRQALRDPRDAPAFVETISGKGYRFIATVEVVSASQSAASAITPDQQSRLTLAVLPFENLSGDSNREYLADGLTEETIASLGWVDPEHVGVIGRTSVMSYKRTAKSLAEIGRELQADYLLESSLRAEGKTFRVTSKLIRARDQVQVWSAVYDRESRSMLELQRELSTAIAQQVRLQLSPDRLMQILGRQTQNAAAYDEYLQARYFANLRTSMSNLRAIQHYQRAIALDPDYALAWAGLSFTYSASAINGDAPPQEVWARARGAADQAVRKNSNLAEAQFVLGYVNWMLEWDWNAAEIHFRKAISLDSGYGFGHLILGHVLSQSSRHVDAEPCMRRSREMDPLDAMTHAMSSQVAFQARDYAAAVEHARRTILIGPEFWIGYMQLGQAYEQMDRTELALEALTDAAQLSGGNSKPIALRGYVLAKTGRTGQAQEILKRLEALACERYVPPCAMALVCAGLGDRKTMFEWLEKGYAARDVHMIFLPVDPKWDAYRTDRQFEDVLSRCAFTRMSFLPEE